MIEDAPHNDRTRVPTRDVNNCRLLSRKIMIIDYHRPNKSVESLLVLSIPSSPSPHSQSLW